MIFMYITVKQSAEKWGISDRRERILCSEGKISGVTREGCSRMTPSNAKTHRMDVLKFGIDESRISAY